MPAAVIADKSLAKALWLQGLTASAIAKQLGTKRDTVQHWVSRYGWKREADITRPAAKEAQAVVAKEVADRVSSIVAEHSEDLIGVIRDTKARTLLDCKTAAAALAASYATYRKATGMDDVGGVQRHMHFHIIDQAVNVERTATIDAVVVDDGTLVGAMALRDVPAAYNTSSVELVDTTVADNDSASGSTLATDSTLPPTPGV